MLFFPEMKYRQPEVQNARADSCTWVLQYEGFMEWVKARQGLLWIKGKPGSGKSTLVKRIFQLPDEETDIRPAFFFHRQGTTLQHTQVGMCRTMLHQLLKRVPPAGAELRSLYEDKNRLGGFGMDRGWGITELRQMFKSALQSAASGHTIRVFIDALDEAGEGPARELVSYICDLSDLLLKPEAAVSICFSCRHYPIVTTNHGFQICVENENDQCLCSFGTWKQNFVSRCGVNAGARLEGSARRYFKQGVRAVPLGASRRSYSCEETQRRRTPGNSPRDASQSAIGSRRGLPHILTNVVNPEDEARRLHLMQWICLAVRPLSLAELRFAMASDDSLIHPLQHWCQEYRGFVKDDAQMKKRTIGLSGGLAEVKYHKGEDKAQFIHQSVNDFLVTGGFRFLDPTSTKDLVGLGHDRLSRSCTNYLKLGEVLCEDGIWNGWGKVHDLPFIYYATKSWFLHARDAESRGISQEKLVQRFETPRQVFEIWVKIYRGITDYSSERVQQSSTLLL